MPRAPTLRAASLVLLVHALAGCGDGDPGALGTEAGWFTDQAAARGLTHVNHCGAAVGKRYLLEEIGNGCALFDADGDGDLDAFLVDACTLRPPRADEVDWQPVGDGQCRLYLNDGSGRFEDVSEAAGLAFRGFGQGVSVADHDNDGDPDLYVTCWGPNLLFRNEGVTDGVPRFTERAAEAGVDHPFWSVGSCWLDAEGDGDLDLYVVNYFAMAVARDPDCWRKVDCPFHELSVACGPKGMVPEEDAYYENLGGGRFRERSAAAGFHSAKPRFGLGAVAFDFDRDGDQDVYVANDSRGNFLFRNDGNGSFEEVADLLGVALNRDGLAQAGMGIACGDYSGDGAPDLFLTNFSHDFNTLYESQQGGDFLDVTRRHAFADRDYFALGWGTEFLDLDQDGDLDLFVANGHLYPEADQRAPELTYGQRNRLFENRDGRFLDVTEEAGPGLALRRSTRGMAAGDVDEDGDLDLLLVEMNGPPTLLINGQKDPDAHHLVLSLEGTHSNRDAVGAVVEVETGAGVQVREVRRGASFLSEHDPRLHFGLGRQTRILRLRVTWPDGTLQEIPGLAIDAWFHWKEGEPEPVRRR